MNSKASSAMVHWLFKLLIWCYFYHLLELTCLSLDNHYYIDQNFTFIKKIKNIIWNWLCQPKVKWEQELNP